MLHVRQYKAADKDALVKLWQSVFPDDPAHNAPKKMIEDKLCVDDLIFVAVSRASDNRASDSRASDNEDEQRPQTIMGACMAGYDGHRGWLYAVAVLPGMRRHGVGEKLVSHSIERLRALGCVKINLQIRADNTEVAAFYRSLGFSVEERLSMGLLL